MRGSTLIRIVLSVGLMYKIWVNNELWISIAVIMMLIESELNNIIRSYKDKITKMKGVNYEL